MGFSLVLCVFEWNSSWCVVIVEAEEEVLGPLSTLLSPLIPKILLDGRAIVYHSCSIFLLLVLVVLHHIQQGEFFIYPELNMLSEMSPFR